MTAASAGVRWTVPKGCVVGARHPHLCFPAVRQVGGRRQRYCTLAGSARHPEGKVSEVGRGSVPVQRGSPGLTVPQMAANSAGAYRAKQPHKYVLTFEDQRHPHFGGERWRDDGCRPS